jgi:hypothetical protein
MDIEQLKLHPKDAFAYVLLPVSVCDSLVQSRHLITVVGNHVYCIAAKVRKDALQLRVECGAITLEVLY